MNKPYELTAQDWEAVAAVREVVEAWGLDDDEESVRGALLADLVYGVRFDYVTDGPGWAGSLYLLQGGGAPEIAPIALVETDDGLRVVEWDQATRGYSQPTPSPSLSSRRAQPGSPAQTGAAPAARAAEQFW